MLSLFGRRRHPKGTAPTLKPRAVRTGRIERIALSELTPASATYFGYAANVELVLFELATDALKLAPTAADRAEAVAVAESFLRTHRGLVEELRAEVGEEWGAALGSHETELARYRDRVAGGTWLEHLVTLYVAAGLLGDFFSGLAEGLPRERAAATARLFDTEATVERLRTLLQAAVEADESVTSPLALWARRLVGDTLLVARAAVGVGVRPPQEDPLEPAFSDLIGEHTRRLDALGLTA